MAAKSAGRSTPEGSTWGRRGEHIDSYMHAHAPHALRGSEGTLHALGSDHDCAMGDSVTYTCVWLDSSGATGIMKGHAHL